MICLKVYRFTFSNEYYEIIPPLYQETDFHSFLNKEEGTDTNHFITSKLVIINIFIPHHTKSGGVIYYPSRVSVHLSVRV